MRVRGAVGVGTAILLALMIAASAGTAIAQQPVGEPASPGPTAIAEDVPAGTSALAAIAGVIGNVFYVPFKAAAMCPGMALAAGASLALTGGHTDTADYFLRIGCAGTWIITPAMVRGQEEFQESGAP